MENCYHVITFSNAKLNGPKEGITLTTKEKQRLLKKRTRILESAFEVHSLPSSATKQSLAKELDMSVRSVQIWFQNRRARVKSHKSPNFSLQWAQPITNKSTDNETSDPNSDNCSTLSHTSFSVETNSQDDTRLRSQNDKMSLNYLLL